MIKSIREHLTSRDSPFIQDNNRGSGFVCDEDAINLHTVRFGSDDSAGAICDQGIPDMSTEDDACLNLPDWAIRQLNII